MSVQAHPAPPRRRRRRKRTLQRVGLNALGLLVFVVMTFPVYWMVSTSFKQGGEILSFTPQFIPTNPTLDNFRDAIDRDLFWSSVRNSLIVVLAVVIVSVVLAFLAALALAKFRFHGRSAFVVVVFGVQMVPLAALVIPLFITFSAIHQVDKLSGIVIAYVALVLPFCVWTLRGFIGGIPKELEEAAMVDGSTRLGAFVRILLPLVGPGLVATSIFAFIQAWNEYIIAYVMLSSADKQTITIWLANFTTGTTRGVDWGTLMAAATLTALPVVHLLRDRAQADRLRPHRRRRQAVSELDRLAAACLQPSFPGHVVPEWVARWLERGLGGITLFAYNVGDPGQLAELTAALRAERPELLISIDEEGGDVTRLEAEHGSSYPGNLALGAVDDVALTEAVASAIAGELASAGVNLNLAPVADANTNPLNPVIGVRSFGSDPDLVARHVAAFVAGTQRQGVAACAKHFPGHGDTAADSHRELPVIGGDLDGALLPFRAAIARGRLRR